MLPGPAIVGLVGFPVGVGLVPGGPVRPGEHVLRVPVVPSDPGVGGVPGQAEHQAVLLLRENGDQLSSLSADTGLAGSLPGNLNTTSVETSYTRKYLLISPRQ